MPQKQERRAGLPGSFLVIHLWERLAYVVLSADFQKFMYYTRTLAVTAT
jgi:hypothetical protein